VFETKCIKGTIDAKSSAPALFFVRTVARPLAIRITFICFHGSLRD